MAHAAALSLRGVLGRPTLVGSLVALLFWSQSLTPSLIPRSWATQAVIGAVSLAIGYGIGTWIGGALRGRGGIVLVAAWLIAIVPGVKLWLGWQDEQRGLMGMAPVTWLDAALVGALSPLAGVLLVVAGRVAARGFAAVKRSIALLILVMVAAGFWRDRGSPFWQPVFDGGRSVRFLNQDPHQRLYDTEWKAPRVAYLQHPADPAICWSFTALWWPPECMARPRGFDMPEAMRWFPIVSGVQAVGDVLNQLDVPSGFGHNYSSEYAEGWASVLPPEGWRPADNERLVRFLDKVPGDESER